VPGAGNEADRLPAFAELWRAGEATGLGRPRWRVAEKAGEGVGEVREVVTSGPVAANAKIMGADTEGAELEGEPGLVDRFMAVVAYGPGAAGKRPEPIHDGGREEATGSGLRKDGAEVAQKLMVDS